ncbi:unnamed protein product, partial [Phaeothamnion confervicola]
KKPRWERSEGQNGSTMACVTVPKRKFAVAPSEVQRAPASRASVAAMQKKARTGTKIADSVREVVNLFQVEHAKVHDQAARLRHQLKERQQQLAVVRGHLSRESSENGTLEATARGRQKRLRAETHRVNCIERAFGTLLAEDRRLAALLDVPRCDLAVFSAESTELWARFSDKATPLLQTVGSAADAADANIAAAAAARITLEEEVKAVHQSLDGHRAAARGRQERAAEVEGARMTARATAAAAVG